MSLDIPREKPFPINACQCDRCGGKGCGLCEGRGWHVPENHPFGRRCAGPGCNRPLQPDWQAVYCSNECALADT